jgi:DNA-binding NarL/FixJ family response regulator
MDSEAVRRHPQIVTHPGPLVMMEQVPYRTGRKPVLPNGDAIECVFLTCFRSEFSVLAIVLQYSRIRMRQAETLDEADFMLTATASTVLVSDTLFLDGSWRDALRMAVEIHPCVATLVAADPVDSPYLFDAYSRGACGALWKPADFGEAVRLIRSADQASRDRALLKNLCASEHDRRYSYGRR